MIFLSAGHSNIDPGAVSVQNIDGKLVERKEADIVAEFRNLVSFYLTQRDIKHDVDGAGTDNVPLANTVKMMRGHAPALEFHCNAGPPSASGVETLSAPKDMALCARLCAAIASTLGTKNRGAKSEDSGQHHRLAFVQGGGIIVELFFISSVTDLAAYDAKKWLLARAVADVLSA
jgi:N-acetylmuramoyl-L-alanine amidase